MPTAIRLRPGVHAAPVAGGLLITGRGATHLVPGEAVVLDALWLRMLPALHRGTDPALLRTRSGLAERIVEALDAAGLLLPPDSSWPADPTLDYLAAFADEPFEAWRRFRALDVAVLGDGPAALAAVRALAGFGLAAAQIRRAIAEDVDVVITTDADADVPAGVAWLGIVPCGERVVVGPLWTAGGGLSVADAVAMLAATPEPTSPVAATLAGNLAAADVLAFGAGLTPGYRWRASVVHVDGARVETVLVATPGARPPAADDAPLYSEDAGPLAAPLRVVDLAGPRDVAQSRLLDGRVVPAFGADPAEAAANASVAAARCFVPEDVAELWHADGSPARDATRRTTVAGTSADGFLRDAIRRILAGDPAGVAPDCFAAPRIVPPADLPSAAAADAGFFERLRIPLTVTVSELRDTPGALTVATVATYGRILGFDCADSEESALVGAFHQAMLVVQRGADPCPAHADDEKWDPRPVLAALAAAGTPLVTGRWTGAPADALPAVLGWAALAAPREDRA